MRSLRAYCAFLSLRPGSASGTCRTGRTDQRDCCGPGPCGFRSEELAGGCVEIEVSVHALGSFRSYGAVEDGLAIGTAGSRGTGITLRTLRSLRAHGTNCTLLSLGSLRPHSTYWSGFALRSLRTGCAGGTNRPLWSLRPSGASGTCRPGFTLRSLWTGEADFRIPVQDVRGLDSRRSAGIKDRIGFCIRTGGEGAGDIGCSH
ncbi:hypothetical protein SDC9_188145 [bioreactor metagenome]|uniref:Uncharacterized protein n=1 Tax=bioreactor metagenome TaxID=1076179 RepID=A0A645HNS1_9ZZZZ